MLRYALLLGLTTPALAQPKAQRCPEGQVVVGLEADGRIVCEAPPRRAAPGPRPRVKVAPFPVDAQGRVVMPHAQFRALLDAPEPVARSARFVPHFRNGVFDGFRVFGIRPASLVGAIGLRNGDRIQAIGGQRLEKIESALEALTAARALAPDSVLTLSGLRRGKPLKITILLSSAAP